MLGPASALYHKGNGDDTKIRKKRNVKKVMSERDKEKERERKKLAKIKREKELEERRQRLEEESKIHKRIDITKILNKKKQENKIELNQRKNSSPSTSQTEVSSRETNINDDDNEDENESFSEVESESEIEDRSPTPADVPLNPNLLDFPNNDRLQNIPVSDVPAEDRTFKRCVCTGVIALIILLCIGIALGILVGSGGKLKFVN
jgi:hypothetical protein